MILGIGVIFLLILWTTTALLWVFCSDSSPQHSKNRTIITVFSSLVTFILIMLPTSSKSGLSIITATTDDSTEPHYLVAYDYLFIWRVILIICLILSILAGFGLIVTQFWAQKVHGSDPVPLKSKQQPEHEHQT